MEGSADIQVMDKVKNLKRTSYPHEKTSCRIKGRLEMGDFKTMFA